MAKLEEETTYQLNGHAFTVWKRIGGGGMGDIYLVTCPELNGGNRMVLKVMKETVDQSELKKASAAIASHAGPHGLNSLSRAAREAAFMDVLRRYPHPNFPKVFACNASIVQPYIALQELGDTLENYMTMTKFFDGPEGHIRSVNTVSGICEALSVIHEFGAVHRDIKPANILFAEKIPELPTTPKLIDFGLCTWDGAANLTKAGYAVGTFGYVAPELIELAKKNVTPGPSIDIFSAGIVLYKLLTGNFPVRRQLSEKINNWMDITQEDAIALTTAYKDDKLKIDPREYDIRINDSYAEVVMRAIKAEPKERYQTASQFKDDLDKCNQGSYDLISRLGGHGEDARQDTVKANCVPGDGSLAELVKKGLERKSAAEDMKANDRFDLEYRIKPRTQISVPAKKPESRFPWLISALGAAVIGGLALAGTYYPDDCENALNAAKRTYYETVGELKSEIGLDNYKQ